MKTDLYTKILLSVIALCLTFNVLRDIRVIPNAYADTSQVVPSVANFPAASLLKTNEDGSLNVRLLASEVVKVEPTSGARFKIEPDSWAEFKVKPVSGAAFEVKPASYTTFKVENTQSDALYVRPHSSAVFNVKQTSTYSSKMLAAESTTHAYPSPASGNVTITYSAFSENEYMTISNMEGKVVDYILLDQSQNELNVDLSQYASGTYIYSFNGNGGKFVVQK